MRLAATTTRNAATPRRRPPGPMVDPDVQQAAAEARVAPAVEGEGRVVSAAGRRLQERVEALAARVLDRSSDPP